MRNEGILLKKRKQLVKAMKKAVAYANENLFVAEILPKLLPDEASLLKFGLKATLKENKKNLKNAYKSLMKEIEKVSKRLND